MARHYLDRAGVTIERDGEAVWMVRGGRCWVKISRLAKGRGRKPGRYAVAYGWKGQAVAIPGRTQYVGTYRHAEISALSWVNGYGF